MKSKHWALIEARTTERNLERRGGGSKGTELTLQAAIWTNCVLHTSTAGECSGRRLLLVSWQRVQAVGSRLGS